MRWNRAQMRNLVVFVGISTCSGQTCLAKAFCDLLLERTQNPNCQSKRDEGAATPLH